MTTIYLIRHAEAEGNLYRISQGQYDSILTERGWRQVAALEKRFADAQIDKVYTSDLYRTCATSSAIWRPRGLEPIRCRELREINVGVWEQMCWGDIAARYPEQMENFSHHPDLWQMEGAETPQQVLDRVLGKLLEIARENEGRTVAVFSHGYAIRMTLAYLQGCTMAEAGATPHGDNTAVSKLAYENGKLRVLFRDDNSHLTTPEYLAGEKTFKRSTALEPGLCFAPLDRVEDRQAVLALARAGWTDGGRTEAFDRDRFLTDARSRHTVVGLRNGEPVGLIQCGEDSDWISFLAVRPDCRKRGYGIQLVGQAVQHARPAGAQRLRMAVAEGSCGGDFFADYGFTPAGDTADGLRLLEKDIHFDPAYLSTI